MRLYDKIIQNGFYEAGLKAANVVDATAASNYYFEKYQGKFDLRKDLQSLQYPVELLTFMEMKAPKYVLINDGEKMPWNGFDEWGILMIITNPHDPIGRQEWKEAQIEGSPQDNHKYLLKLTIIANPQKSGIYSRQCMLVLGEDLRLVEIFNEPAFYWLTPLIDAEELQHLTTLVECSIFAASALRHANAPCKLHQPDSTIMEQYKRITGSTLGLWIEMLPTDYSKIV